MFDQVEDKKGGQNWIMLGSLAAFAALLVAGYLMIT